MKRDPRTYGSENTNDRNHSQIEEDDDGGNDIPRNLVLEQSHIEDKPSSISNSAECGKEQEPIKNLHKVVFVKKYHAECHKTNNNYNRERIYNSLPNSVPRIVRFLLIYHVYPSLMKEEKVLRHSFFKRIGHLRRPDHIHQDTRPQPIEIGKTYVDSSMVIPTGTTIEDRWLTPYQMTYVESVRRFRSCFVSYTSLDIQTRTFEVTSTCVSLMTYSHRRKVSERKDITRKPSGRFIQNTSSFLH